MKKKAIIEVKVKDMAYPNFSIGEHEGKKIEFKGGLLGQVCSVKITRNRQSGMKGKFMGLVEKSELEKNENHCPNVNECGGCAYQRLDYDTEIKLKENMIIKLLEKENIDYKDHIKVNKSPKIYEYRNKMEYTFGDSIKDGPLVLGLHKQARFYEIVDTKDCNIVDGDFNLLRERIQEFFRKKGTSFYHKKTRQGLLRHCIIRKAMKTGQIMVILVTSSDPSFDQKLKDKFIEELLASKTYGEVVSIFHVTNDALADAVVVEKMEKIYGSSYIEEEMLDMKFRISPFSFFQPNIYTAENLYKKAFEFAKIDKNTKVLDLYSGTGTITQIMASKCKEAVGIEIVEEAVEKAKENAILNNIDNIEFIAGDVLKEIENVKDDFDIVVLDPPREGINPKAIDKIIDINPKKFVYISCNPKSQVRDIHIFQEKGYKLKEYEIFDQFSRSRHLEAIALLEK